MGRSRSRRGRDNYPVAVAGVKLWIIEVHGQEIPVVDLEKDSLFCGNVSWLLQQALDCGGKADSQFEFCSDRDIVEVCRSQFGVSKDEVYCVRLLRDDIRHLRAVGLAGKRSVMMACTIALYRDPGVYTMSHRSFWQSLQDYELDGPFQELMESVDGKQDSKDYWSGEGGGGQGGYDTLERGVYSEHGIELNIVCGKVPVVTVDQHSIFNGNASWLLQAVTEAEGKADKLYHYIEDRAIAAECETLGYSYDELSIAALRNREGPEIIAVGTNGKRSVMFALCIALALMDEGASEALNRDIRASYEDLLIPMKDVLVAALKRFEGRSARAGHGSKSAYGGSEGHRDRSRSSRGSCSSKFRDDGLRGQQRGRSPQLRPRRHGRSGSRKGSSSRKGHSPFSRKVKPEVSPKRRNRLDLDGYFARK